jgi:hypothetical protein
MVKPMTVAGTPARPVRVIMRCNRAVPTVLAALLATALVFSPAATGSPLDNYSLEDRLFIVMLAENDMLPTTGNPADTDVLITKAHAICNFQDPGDGGKAFANLMEALFPNSQGDYTLKFAVYAQRAYCMPG